MKVTHLRGSLGEGTDAPLQGVYVLMLVSDPMRQPAVAAVLEDPGAFVETGRLSLNPLGFRATWDRQL